MRELKFRGWNRIVCRMSDPVLIDKFPADTQWQNLVIMQSTGLEDKTGKEIFEGDIVSDENGTTVIEWAAGMGAWGLLDSDECMFMLADCNETMEIIGNIYENSELMPQ